MRVIEAELHVEIQRLEFENPSRAWMIFDEYRNYSTLLVVNQASVLNEAVTVDHLESI